MFGYMLAGWFSAWIWCRVIRRERGPSGVSLATLALGWLIGRLTGDRPPKDQGIRYYQRR